MRILINNQIVGCGLVVLEEGFLGLFKIIVDENYQNQGLGCKLVDNLINCGKINGV